jgi:hypothetical protein
MRKAQPKMARRCLLCTDTRLLFAAVALKEEEVELARRREQASHEHDVVAAETGNGWRCDVCLQSCTVLGQRYRCVEGCDYDICEQCRAHSAATAAAEGEAAAAAAAAAEPAPPASFLSLQQEQDAQEGA